MEKASGTRSGLLWKVERILTECKNKPQILLMENVTQVHGVGNDIYFKQWQLRLEELGYMNYWEDLIATDYGIPQTRKRTFMISILNGKNGEKYNFRFPKKIPLKLRLKDLLESNVDEKFYISNATFKQIKKWNSYQNPLDSVMGMESIYPTITTRIAESQDGGINASMKVLSEDLDETTNLKKPSFEEVYSHLKDSNFSQQASKIQEKDNCDTLLARDYKDPKCVIVETNLYENGLKQYNRRTGVVLNPDGSMTTLLARRNGDNSMILEKGTNNSRLNETLLKNDLTDVKDVAYIDAYNKRVIKDGTAKTILTGVDFRNQDFIAIKEDDDSVSVPLKRGYSCEVKKELEDSKEIDYIGNYSKSNFNQTSIVGKNGVAPTVTENHGQVTAITEEEKIPQVLGGIGEKKSNGGTQWYQQDRIYNDNVAITTTTINNPYYKVGLRIRKLTPKECFRLMGLKDDDIDLVMENQSNASAYHLAGDSIVTTCLMAILGQLFDIDWNTKFKPEEWWKK